jgi:hypothetical protein
METIEWSKSDNLQMVGGKLSTVAIDDDAEQFAVSPFDAIPGISFILKLF